MCVDMIKYLIIIKILKCFESDFVCFKSDSILENKENNMILYIKRINK